MSSGVTGRQLTGAAKLGWRIEYAAPPAATSPTPCSVRPPK